MALVVNESTVVAESHGAGVGRQRLLTEARVKGARILLDRRTLDPGASAALDVPAASLAWFQVLEGEAMVFVEFFVPGEYRTIWAPGASVCTWLPTRRDIRGQTARARDPGAQLGSRGEPPRCMKCDG